MTVLTTYSGRQITAPSIRLSRNFTHKDIKAADQWLCDEARKELEAIPSDQTRIAQPGSLQAKKEYLLDTIQGMNAARLSDGDKSTLWYVLTGSHRIPAVFHLVDRRTPQDLRREK